MSAVSVLQSAVSLAKQGVHQDKAKNYPEAARCYRESIAAFSSVRHKSANAAVAAAIDEKISQYRDRLRKIDKYLLTKADLSEVLKSAVDYHNPELSHDEGDSIEKGLRLIEKAKTKDSRGWFKEAMKLYEEAVTLLMSQMRSQDQMSQEKLRFKCLLVHERVEAIRNSLESGLNPVSSPSFDVVDAIDADSPTSSPSSSPEPLESEEQVMLMTPFHSESDLNEKCGFIESMHSLYPLCEVKDFRGSTASVDSDYLGGSSSGGSGSSPLPTLANIDQELTISSDTLPFVQPIRMMGVHSADSLSSSTSLAQLKRYRSLQLNTEPEISHLALTKIPSALGTSCDFEKDRSVPELLVDDRGSDSGISNDLPDSSKKRIRSLESMRDMTPVKVRSRSLTPAIKMSTPIKMTLIEPDSTEELTVLSSEDVNSEPEQSHKNEELEKSEVERIPSRATASRQEEDSMNEGCFVFLSCLDAFGIL